MTADRTSQQRFQAEFGHVPLLFFAQNTVQLRARRDGVEHRAVFLHVVVQQCEPMFVFIRIHDDLVVDRFHLRGGILAHAFHEHFHAAQGKFQYWCDPLDALMMQADKAASNNSAGLNASVRPARSVSNVMSTDLHFAKLPWPSMRTVFTWKINFLFGLLMASSLRKKLPPTFAIMGRWRMSFNQRGWLGTEYPARR